MGTFYIKKLNDINTYGHVFDSYCLDLDSLANSINLGNPDRDYYALKKIGNGVIIRGGNSYTERKMSFNFPYYDPTSSTRETFLKDWIYSDDKKYLYRDDLNGLTRIEVLLNVKSNEAWKNYIMSEDITIEMLSEMPFFQRITADSYSATLPIGTTIIPFINDGISTPFILNFTFDNIASGFIAKMYENVGINITYSFIANNTLKIDTSNLNVWINSQLRFPDAYYAFTGSPFRMETGTNNLKITTDASGDLLITYYKRYL